ncbi:tRNA-dihydrouridine(47) synthase [NAD(P)(+)]-like isoform X1 [Malaclemys terrapin pileata]|uniref:tRNA-dihydrouridine(47) synthase [NAD(P)(+)]-like isoform X1 n=1 Tax=Malaclemys terrapin pileata TaxID=2991368 RepID=UPI0023A8A82A|nr:tRNA-dihydrouridine(47) synthase [NAD(P)(+)]-like isoform X1 [Malaclemys terrapin pileata]
MEAAGAGVAPIRAQYLTSKDQFHAYLKAERESRNQENNQDDVREEDPSSNDQTEPPAKQMKLDGGDQVRKQGSQEEVVKEEEKKPQERKRARGQNKSRPCMKPNHYEKDRLCQSVIQECAEKCYFGSQCRFLHDVGEYMAAKPSDLGDSCVLFKTFGKCIYGVTCRFARAHLGEDYRNIINEDLVKQWEGKPLVRNSLSKELQQRLRKKKVCFDKSSEYLRHLGKPSSTGNAGNKAAGNSMGEKGMTNCTASKGNAEGVDVLPPGEEAPECLAVSEKGEAPESMVLQSSCLADASKDSTLKTIGPVTDEDVIKLRLCEKKRLAIQGKLYLAPLTTCGNLPFRRICKRFGADVTCGEMAVCTNLLQGQSSEWALLKRHYTEDLFGVQLEGAFPDTMTRCAELLNQTIEMDFVDINVGCPIDLVYKKGGGCALMNRSNKFEQIVRGMNSVLDVPLTVKIRTGVQEKVNLAHKVIPNIRRWGASMVTLHGRSREQRYTKVADWEYIAECAKLASPMPLFGNGDILSYEDANRAMQTGVSGIMIARGALIKPWIFTEVKEQRHWDISSNERLDILKDFTNYGLEHWGSDTQGVEKTRKFMLEWLSFLCRYIPAGLLEYLPQKINERPPYYMGRDYLETLMASQNVDDWIKISEMLLGPVPTNFTFLPKHKANSYR